MSERILKQIASDDDARERLLKGLTILSDVVGSTMGYRGRTVLIETPFGMPEPTKDGYKTSKSIHLSDPVESMACEIAKQASQRTLDMAGDSTTLTIVLLQAFFKNSLKAIKNGKSPIDVKNDIEKSRDLIIKYLDEISIPVTDKLIYDVAYTSASADEEIAKIVAEAFIKAGEHGSVSHLRSVNEETYLEHIEGVLVESNLAHDLLINNLSERTCELDDNPLIVCSNIIFKTWRQIEPFLNFAAKNKRQIIIVADWNDSQCFGVKDVIVQNVLKGNLSCMLVNAPSFGNKRRDLVSDLAMICGTQLLSSLSGDVFDGREAQFMGTCKSAISGKTDTIITPHLTDEIQLAIDSKIAELDQIAKTTKNNLEKQYLRERISKLSGGVSIIKVGSIIESELQEKIDRVDDAVCAVRSAKEEGVLAGGGVALFYANTDLELDSVTEIAIDAPILKILSNANVKEFVGSLYPMGYDVKNFKEVNMIEAGIVDSNKAIKNALINAVSASNTLLLTNYVVTNRRGTYGTEE
jgi:chaperonin GroEL